MSPESLALGGPANGRQALSAPPPRGPHEPRPRRAAPPSFSTFVSFRAELDFVCRAGGSRLRLPAQDVMPRTGDTPRFQWAPRSRTPRGCRSRFTRLGEEAAEPEGPRDPRRRTKGPGPRPPRPRPPRGRALGPSPAPPGPREMADALQNGSRVGRGVETRGARSPVPPAASVPSHAVCAPALLALEPQGKELGGASQSR